MTDEMPKNKYRNLANTLIASFLGLIFLLQLGIFYLALNPINLLNELNTVKVINEATKAISVPPNELPQIGVIGDGKNLGKADDLRKNNAVDGEIYKDAKDGDYVLGYTSKLIVYRPDDKRIIYNGDTPQMRLQQSQKAVVDTVVKAAKDKGLIPGNYDKQPQVSVVTDAEAIKKSNSFYADVMKDDIVATFSDPELLVIYRTGEGKIVKSGTFELTVK